MFSLVWYSKHFIALCFNFSLWCILSDSCEGCEVSFCIRILHVGVLLFQHHLLKRLYFLHWIAFASLSMISWLHLYGSIPGLSILWHWSAHYFTNNILFDKCSFIAGLKIGWYECFQYLLLLWYCIGYSGPLPFHINFRINL